MQSWAGYEKPPDDDEDVDVKIQKTISMESLKENTNIVDTNENLKWILWTTILLWKSFSDEGAGQFQMSQTRIPD